MHFGQSFDKMLKKCTLADPCSQQQTRNWILNLSINYSLWFSVNCRELVVGAKVEVTSASRIVLSTMYELYYTYHHSIFTVIVLLERHKLRCGSRWLTRQSQHVGVWDLSATMYYYSSSYLWLAGKKLDLITFRNRFWHDFKRFLRPHRRSKGRSNPKKLEYRRFLNIIDNRPKTHSGY